MCAVFIILIWIVLSLTIKKYIFSAIIETNHHCYLSLLPLPSPQKNWVKFLNDRIKMLSVDNVTCTYMHIE